MRQIAIFKRDPVLTLHNANTHQCVPGRNCRTLHLSIIMHRFIRGRAICPIDSSTSSRMEQMGPDGLLGPIASTQQVPTPATVKVVQLYCRAGSVLPQTHTHTQVESRGQGTCLGRSIPTRSCRAGEGFRSEWSLENGKHAIENAPRSGGRGLGKDSKCSKNKTKQNTFTQAR